MADAIQVKAKQLYTVLMHDNTFIATKTNKIGACAADKALQGTVGQGKEARKKQTKFLKIASYQTSYDIPCSSSSITPDSFTRYLVENGVNMADVKSH